MSTTAWILLVGLGVLAGTVVLLNVTRRKGGDAQGSLIQITNDETWTVMRDANGRISGMRTTRLVTPTLIAHRTT